ncbi:Hyalin [Holothuria leucospilota]|uniref:Hyalin n=1 Tax=Holothuria leucospilota TaxID=206669 RepID=A0A9Q1H1J4_HOLLE|nr:Hyalin [Holothuria leucospilota]
MFLKGFWNLVLIFVLSPSSDAQSFPPPDILNCPPNILHAIPYEEESTIVTWQQPSSDPQLTPTRSHIPGTRFNAGKTSVRYTFRSSLDVTANCDFTVEVKRIDTTPPKIEQCPRGVSAPISPNERSVSVNWTEPTATDNTGTEVRTTKTHSPGDMFVRGFTRVNYTFTDTTGNINLCSFTVTVYLVDNIPPTIENCPSDVTMRVQNHSVYEAVSWMEPSATDETSQNVDLEVYRSHSPGDRFRAGVTNVLYVFADESQNAVFCTFQIHLDPPEAPRVSSCPRSRVEIVENNDPEPAVTDQENPQFITVGTSIAVTETPSNPWNRTFVQRQLSPGNDVVCSYDVYIFRIDTIAPDIANCQSRREVMTASLGLGAWAGSVTVPDFTTDFTVSYNPEAIESYPFPVGETVLAVLLEDDAKNSRVCSISVVVNPTIIGCPKRIRGESKTNENSLEVYWPSPSSLRGFPISVTPPSGSLFMMESTLVQHVFAESPDGSGVREICEFEVIVTEENPLEITSCPEDIVMTLLSDSDSVVVTWELPGAENKLGSEFKVIGISTTHNSGDDFSVGDTSVVYVFESGDERFQINCTFSVSVKDITPPEFLGCPSHVRLSVLAWYGTFDWKQEIVPKDNSNITEVFASHEANFRYPLGETPVNLTVVDSSGNRAVCSFPVTVSLILPLPVLILLGVVILLIVVFIISCCCRCRKRWSKKDEGAPLSQDIQSLNGHHSNKGYDNQQAQGGKNSKEISDPPLTEGNKYLSEMEMNSMHPSKPTPQNNAGGYVYVAETAPPVPTTPRPSKVEYVNDSVGLKNVKKSSTVVAPTLSDEGYLKPTEHQYLSADNIGNPNEYSYAYDHDHRRHPQS